MHEKVLWVLKKAGNEDNFEEYNIINKRTKGMVWKEKHCIFTKKILNINTLIIKIDKKKILVKKVLYMTYVV